VKPYSRSRRNESRMDPTVCRRPMERSSRLSKVCAPREIRFTPCSESIFNFPAGRVPDWLPAIFHNPPQPGNRPASGKKIGDMPRGQEAGSASSKVNGIHFAGKGAGNSSISRMTAFVYLSAAGRFMAG